jgi:signal transduction histidine kinase/CheY-like chemotaxis protein
VGATDAFSQRALVLAPGGRDAAVAGAILRQANLGVVACASAEDMQSHLKRGAALALAVEEALDDVDVVKLKTWVDAQPRWSDFPFVVLTRHGGGLERNPRARALSESLGNVSFLERPFHATTLVSVVRTALRGRLRQYEARAMIEDIRRAEATLERRVQERTGELEAANRQLAAQIAEREKVESALRQSQRLEAVGQLTAGVAHDFNNLLMVVLGTVRMMRKHVKDPDLTRRLDMVTEAAQRGARLTSQMLAFARRQKLDARPVALNDTVQSMLELLRSTMGGTIRIETKLADDLWTAMIDPTQIELMILNLAINGRDAMEVGGTLTLETANVRLTDPRGPEEPVAGEYVMIAISDTGSGMTPEVRAKAFEPFFTTKAVGKGSGLGLSQVFGLARQSGGGVRIDTKLGEGTSVRVYLPRANVISLESRASRRTQPVQRAAGAVVLLVDDDNAVREVTAGMLAELGFEVIATGSGGHALEELDRKQRIDLVLLDFAMPGMNGAELAREMRARRPDLPILFATGLAEAARSAVGADVPVLQKPFTPDELSRQLAEAMQDSQIDY